MDIPRSAGINEMINAYFGDEWHTRDLRADRGFQLVLKGQMVVTDQDIVTPDEMQRSPRRDKSPVILRVLSVHGAARTPFLGSRLTSYQSGCRPYRPICPVGRPI